MNYFHYLSKEILNGSSINWYFESTKKNGMKKEYWFFIHQNIFENQYFFRKKNQYLFFENQHFILGLCQRKSHVQRLVIIIYKTASLFNFSLSLSFLRFSLWKKPILYFLTAFTKHSVFWKKHFFIMHFLKNQFFQKAQLQKAEPNSPNINEKKTT